MSGGGFAEGFQQRGDHDGVELAVRAAHDFLHGF